MAVANGGTAGSAAVAPSSGKANAVATTCVNARALKTNNLINKKPRLTKSGFCSFIQTRPHHKAFSGASDDKLDGLELGIIQELLLWCLVGDQVKARFADNRLMSESSKMITRRMAVLAGIVAILALVVVPNFLPARVTISRNACFEAFVAIETAKRNYARAHGLKADDTVSLSSLIGSPYLKSMPVCPAGGDYSASMIVSNLPSCSVDAHSYANWVSYTGLLARSGSPVRFPR